MVIEINKETKEIKIKKDCKACIHIDICKFHRDMSKLTKSNEWYGIAYYSESNDTLKVFEEKSYCQHYKYKYSYDLKNYKNIDPNVVSAILRNEGINQYVIPKVNNDWDGIIEAKSEKIDFKKLSKKYTIL